MHEVLLQLLVSEIPLQLLVSEIPLQLLVSEIPRQLLERTQGFAADPDYWKGEVFAYVGRNQNLKDLNADQAGWRLGRASGRDARGCRQNELLTALPSIKTNC
jgi:hypothetical protein